MTKSEFITLAASLGYCTKAEAGAYAGQRDDSRKPTSRRCPGTPSGGGQPCTGNPRTAGILFRAADGRRRNTPFITVTTDKEIEKSQ